MTRLKLFIPFVLFIVIGGFFYIMMNRINEGEYHPQALPSALVNKSFPAFQLPKLEQLEKTVTVKDMLGQIALVNVWATWCPSCHEEHQYLNQLAQQGVTIFGINYKDDVFKAQDWLEKKGNPYRLNVVDRQGKLGLDMGVTGAPETYVIDHRGFVRLRFQGPLNEKVWQSKFAPLLEQLQSEKQQEEGKS